MRVNVCRSMVALLLTAACSADTGLTTPSAERDIIADRLTQVADSISLESNEAAAQPYRELSALVRRTEHPSVASLTLDGEPLPFSAVALERIVAAPCDAASASESSGTGDASSCGRTARLRTLLAWHAASRRLLMLTSVAEAGALGVPVDGARDAQPAGQLRFFDQSGRAGWAVTGTFRSSVKTEGECPPLRSVDAERETARCLRARFMWELEAKTARRDETREGAPPSVVTHTIAFGPAQVDGAQWTFTPAATPPASSSASPLVAALRTRVDSVVSLALVVRNDSDVPVTLRFPAGPQYDFEIRDRGGNTVWRWSDGQTFVDESTARTIPAHGNITFSERWAPSAHGDLIVVATMTSATPRVSARAALTVP